MENKINFNNSISDIKSIDNSSKKEISLNISSSLSFPEPTSISSRKFDSIKESKMAVNINVSRSHTDPVISINMPVLEDSVKTSDIFKTNLDIGTDETTIKNDLKILKNEGKRLDFVAFDSDQRKRFKNHMNKVITLSENSPNFNSKELQEIKNIIGKMSTTFSRSSDLSAEEINKLKSYLSSSNNLPKSDLETLNKMLVNLEKSDAGLKTLSENVKNLRNQVSSSIDDILLNIDKVSPKKALTNVMKDLYEGYKKALDSGNEVDIERYAKLIGDVSNVVKNGGAGSDILNLVDNYNTNSRTFSDQSSSSTQRVAALSRIVKPQIFDNFRQQAIENLTRMSNHFSLGASTQNFSINHNQKFTNNQSIDGLTDEQINNEIISIATNVSLSEPTIHGIEVPMEIEMNEKDREELTNATKEDIQEVIKKYPGLKASIDTFEKINDKYMEAKDELDKFLLSMNTLKPKIENKESIKSKIDRIIKSNIDELIKKALEFESKLNLEVDGSSASIVSLLEKFRAIITTLDLDSKLNLRRSLESLSISNSFSSQKRDMKVRWDSLDKAKKELNEIIKSIQESKIA